MILFQLQQLNGNKNIGTPFGIKNIQEFYSHVNKNHYNRKNKLKVKANKTGYNQLTC